jgi:hypothetical protein
VKFLDQLLHLSAETWNPPFQVCECACRSKVCTPGSKLGQMTDERPDDNF